MFDDVRECRRRAVVEEWRVGREVAKGRALERADRAPGARDEAASRIVQRDDVTRDSRLRPVMAPGRTVARVENGHAVCVAREGVGGQGRVDEARVEAGAVEGIGPGSDD